MKKIIKVRDTSLLNKKSLKLYLYLQQLISVKPAEEGTHKHSFNVDALVETLSKDRYLDTPCIPELKLMLEAIKQRKKTSNIAKLYVLQCVYNVLLENQ